MNTLKHQKCKNDNTSSRNSWYNWLINNISETINNLGGVTNKIVSLFKTNTNKNYSKPRKSETKTSRR